MADLAFKYPNLAEISGESINEAGLRALGIKGSALTSLEFEHARATNAGIDILCKGNRGLKKLSLPMGHDSSVTDEGVRSIVKYCPELEQISLVGWNKISNKSFDLLSTLPCLKKVSLSYYKNLNIAGIISLLRRIGGQLEVLKLCGESDRTRQMSSYGNNALLQCIGECCPKLRELDVDSRTTDNITEVTFATLFQGCPLLEALECTHLPDIGLFQLAQHCPRLLKLELYTRGLFDAGIVAVSKGCAGLKILRLHYADLLTDASILSLTGRCKNLEDIYLANSTAVTDRALTQLFESCTGLTAVYLRALPLITDQSIETLVSCCPRLKDISFAFVTDKSMAALARVATLERLRLEWSPTLTDDTISLIALNCKKLKRAAITNCPLVTVQGLIELLTHGKRLIDIEIYKCSITLTPEILETYLTRQPGARRLEVHLDDGFAYAK